MPPRKFKIFVLKGVPVWVDLSWLVLLPFALGSLGAVVFPALVTELPAISYWVMAVLAGLGVVVSLLLREIGRILVIHRLDMPVAETTLFVFGGITDLRPHPTKGRAEIMLAAAGLLISLSLAFLFLLATFKLSGAGTPLILTGTGFLLGGFNAAIALFNLIPAYPLDGGRLIRILFAYRIPERERASRRVAAIGAALAAAAVFGGLFVLVELHALSGLWLIVLAFLVGDAAVRSHRKAWKG